MGRACIEYLLWDELDQSPCQSLNELRERISNQPFLSYAASSWLRHYAQEYASDELESLAVRLLPPPQRLATATRIVLWHKRTLDDIEQDFQEIFTNRQEITALQIVSNLGLAKIAMDLVEPDVHPKNSSIKSDDKSAEEEIFEHLAKSLLRSVHDYESDAEQR